MRSWCLIFFPVQDQNVELSVVSLQFEDLILQLIRNMEKKFTLSENLMESLGASFDAHATPEIVEQRLKEIRGNLETQKQLFEEASKASVQSTAMDEGDIEFFRRSKRDIFSDDP